MTSFTLSLGKLRIGLAGISYSMGKFCISWDVVVGCIRSVNIMGKITLGRSICVACGGEDHCNHGSRF